MKTVRTPIDPDNPATLPTGKVDFIRLDATTEQDIAAQQHMDESDEVLDVYSDTCY